MTSTLASPRVTSVLNRLFDAGRRQDEKAPAAYRDHLGSRSLEELFEHRDRAELTDELKDIYMPVTREAGEALYLLTRMRRATRVVEFGTSYAISTIYLAAAVRDNGGGTIVTTEMQADKARAAGENLAAAGLDDLVEIRVGDALDTLRDLDGPVDLVLLDGWEDLYLPVLRLVESRLTAGSVVIADDVSFFPDTFRPYLDHLSTGYCSLTVPVGNGLEISLRL
ncbi:class I SAM-dependent methyltransferase [Streptomyces sp. NPDC045470]|uniref:O-methyltransferase n=1 Tax=unclassified Streptomyces TaxID=2593676 RepID=UPI0033D653C2